MKPNLENLKALIHCPVCSKEYRPARMLLLDEADRRSTLHLTCESCHASSLVFVSLSPIGAVSMGLLTDLEQSEAKRLFTSEPISSDEVLQVHQYLKTHRGVVDELIR